MKSTFDWLTELEISFKDVINLDRDYVFSSGSRVEGFGTEASDIDLFVVTDLICFRTFGKIILPTGRGIKLDADFLSHKQMHEIAQQINSLDFENLLEINDVPDDIFVQYSRIAIGEPLVNAEFFYPIRSLFNKKTLARMFEVNRSIKCQSCLSDAESKIKDNDKELACIYIQRAVEYAIDSHLASLGECYIGSRWRFEMIKRVEDQSSKFYRDAWRLKAPGNTNQLTYIKEGTEFCQIFGIKKYPMPELHNIPHYKKTVDAELVKYSDRLYLVYNQVLPYEVNQEECYVWAILNEYCTKESMASNMAHHFNMEPEKATHSVSACITRLQQYGLVEMI